MPLTFCVRSPGKRSVLDPHGGGVAVTSYVVIRFQKHTITLEKPLKSNSAKKTSEHFNKEKYS